MRAVARLALCSFVALPGVTLSQTALAQSGAVTIHATFMVVIDRIRPNPYPGIERTNQLSVTLSGRNNVGEQWDNKAGNVRRQSGSVRVLGATGERGGQWRVLSGNRLVRVVELPQNQTIITISTSGSSCSIDVQWRLRPGYSEYIFPNLRNGQMEVYGRPRLTSTSCRIG